MNSSAHRIAGVLAVAAAAGAASGATVNSSARGWYDSTGRHVSNNNYLTGNASGTVYRSWFTFNLPTPPIGQGVVSATLRTNAFSVTSNIGLTLYDFTGSVAGLSASTPSGDPAGLARYADLGAGTIYGSRNFLTGEANSFVTYSLNADALSAINAGLGSAFAIGGASNSESSSGAFAYGSSDSAAAFDGSVQLILEYGDLNLVPLPPGVALGMSGLGCAAFAGVLHRRRQRAAAMR